MKTIRETWPKAKDDGSWVEDGPEGYRDLIDTFGYDVAAEGHDDDYQGDSFYLLRDGGRYGFLSFGWGSCSGCDQFQGCRTVDELEELQKHLYDKIEWFDTRADFDRFLADDKLHEGRFYGSSSGFAAFKLAAAE